MVVYNSFAAALSPFYYITHSFQHSSKCRRYPVLLLCALVGAESPAVVGGELGVGGDRVLQVIEVARRPNSAGHMVSRVRQHNLYSLSPALIRPCTVYFP